MCDTETAGFKKMFLRNFEPSDRNDNGYRVVASAVPGHYKSCVVESVNERGPTIVQTLCILVRYTLQYITFGDCSGRKAITTLKD